jgi:hypothetical protein
MAKYTILYWKHIPSMIRVSEGAEEVEVSLGERFEALIDDAATKAGKTGADDYLDGWHESEEQERPGSAADVAAAIKSELEAKEYTV